MGVDNQRKSDRCRTGSAVRLIIVLLYLFLLVLMVVPAMAFTSSGGVSRGNDGTVVSDSVSIQGTGAGMSQVYAASDRTLKASPTPTPARLNRTPLIQTLVKTAAERPKLTVPAFWFILIVAIAFIGIGAILYLLIRKGKGSSYGPLKHVKESSGHKTSLDTPASVEPVRRTTPQYPEPAIMFPPSLEKRFLNPAFIGEGGLARVFRAQNAKTHETVAVKVPVRFDEITGTHFTRDIVFWQGLEHKNIIRIISSNILPVPYIEMEYAPSSLAALPLPLPEDKAMEIIIGIARGLAYAHGKGIVHRDIKPENILIAADGTPKITDWGLGKAISDPRQSSMIGFSPSYAAPEQIAPHRYGKPGPATDIYQIGMLLYEMLTGSVAFESEGMHDLHCAILEDTPAIPSWNGRHEDEIRKIILKCLAKRPEDRYASVAELVSDLESVRNSV